MNETITLSYDTAKEVYNAIAYVVCQFYVAEHDEIPDIEWLNGETTALFRDYCEAQDITDIELSSDTKN